MGTATPLTGNLGQGLAPILEGLDTLDRQTLDRLDQAVARYTAEKGLRGVTVLSVRWNRILLSAPPPAVPLLRLDEINLLTALEGIAEITSARIVPTPAL